MRRNDLPEEGHGLEEDIGGVERGKGPFVPVVAWRCGLEVGVHACYAGVADVCRW